MPTVALFLRVDSKSQSFLLLIRQSLTVFVKFAKAEFAILKTLGTRGTKLFKNREFYVDLTF